MELSRLTHVSTSTAFVDCNSMVTKEISPAAAEDSTRQSEFTQQERCRLLCDMCNHPVVVCKSHYALASINLL